MIVIDSSALIAILRREPEADSFLRIIAAENECLLSAVSLLETSMVLAGRAGTSTSWAELDVLITRANIEVVAQDVDLTQKAREAFMRYGKGSHPAGLNLSDCASHALASSHRVPLLFKGNDFSETDLVVVY